MLNNLATKMVTEFAVGSYTTELRKYIILLTVVSSSIFLILTQGYTCWF